MFKVRAISKFFTIISLVIDFYRVFSNGKAGKENKSLSFSTTYDHWSHMVSGFSIDEFSAVTTAS